MAAQINYMLDVQTPFQASMQGFQGGLAMQQAQQQQQAQQLALQQAEAERQAKLAMQRDLASLSAKPNASAADYAAMMTRYPALAENLKRASDTMSSAQQQASLGHATEVLAALQTGNPKIASEHLRERATAMRNSGNEREAKAQEVMADWIDRDPNSARTAVALRVAAATGPEKFAETFAKLGAEQRAADEAPHDLAKKKADAETAQTTAKFAESKIVSDLKLSAANVKHLEADTDIKRQNTRISAMNAAIAREGNALKRQELQLKIEDAITARDTKVREKVAEAENGATSIDNMLNTIERVKVAPGLNNVLGSIEGRLPSIFSDKNVDAEALVETLTSQAFVAQIPSIKGTGALSDAEGKKLQTALQSLDRKQSEKQFRTNLDEAARLLTKARTTLSTRTGVPLGKPDTPAAPGARPPLSSFSKP